MRKAVVSILLCLLLGAVTFSASLPTNGFDISLGTGDLYVSAAAESAFSDRKAALDGVQLDGGTDYTGPIVESGSYDLDPGVYTFTISGSFECNAVLELYSPRYVGADNSAGRVFASAEIAATSSAGALFVDTNEVIRGARLRVSRSGEGELYIRAITGEGNIYSDTYVFTALVVISAAFILLFLSRRKDELGRREYGSVTALFACALAAVISTAPLARQVLPYAHDASFHLSRIDGIADGLRSGSFPVRINPAFLGGYGYADATMYPSTFLYFPAVLRLLGVSTIVTYQLFILAINGLTAGLSYACFKRLLRRRDLAVFASVAYTLCLYRLICVFTRGAIGELLAMAFLPAVLLGMYEVFFGDTRRGLRWLSAGFLGLVNSHVLSLEITAVFCTVFLLFNLRRLAEPKRLKALAAAAAVVIMLSLWIVVPMLDLMRGEMHATAYIRGIADDAVFPFELFATFVSSNGLSGDRNEGFTKMPLTVGGILAIGALLFLFLRYFWRSDRPEDKRLGALGIGSLKLALAALFVASTLFPWQAVSKIPHFGDFLSAVQFPWRYLGIASLTLVVVITVATARLCDITRHRRLTIFICAAIIAMSCSPYLDGYMQNALQGTILHNKHTPLSTFYIGGQEYLHTGTSVTLLEAREPVIIAGGATIESVSKRYLSVDFSYSDAEGSAYAELPLYYYNGYRAVDGSGNALIIRAGENGVVQVRLPDGSGNVSVFYKPPVIYRVSEGISFLAALMTAAIFIRSGRKKQMDTRYLPLSDVELGINPNSGRGASPNIRLVETASGEAIQIVDQTLLPNELKLLTLSGAEELYEAIYSLRVRGAPAIGIFAAYAIYLLAAGIEETGFDGFYNEFTRLRLYLDSSRPTAVNLGRQLSRMDAAACANKALPIPELLRELRAEAFAIHREDIAMCKAISEYGLELVKDGDGVLTHCNAGPLATSRYGTGIGPLLLAAERGITLHAYCDETRPLLQGARLTAYELHNAGADTTLICDNMASIVMAEGKINAAFVGCDRVAVNGDVANKIGTSGVAILAKHYGIPVYVFCPSSTIDPNCKSGADIEIELREPEEIKEKFFTQPMAPAGVKCYNPAFDVTPNGLITAIVTEKGICRPPYSESLRKLYE